MAAERGVQPIAIALAWVLCQPFPTFPLIGPRTLSETRTSLSGLELKLTAGEVAWLNLED
jgi:aryl-alcohol dehydrogenase-like predicted oxidoreductase